MTRIQSASVVSPLLLLIVISQATAWVQLVIGTKMHSLQSVWTYKGNLALCLTKDGSTCHLDQFVIYPRDLTSRRQEMRRNTLLPWTGSTMGLMMREMSTNTTAVADVSHLELYGAGTSMTFLGLDIDLRIRCAPDFYGSECTKGCAVTEHHHDCASNGSYICLEGRSGQYCEYSAAGTRDEPAEAEADAADAADAAAATAAPVAQAFISVDQEPNDHIMFFFGTIIGVLAIIAVVSLLLHRRRTSTHIRGQQMESMLEA